MSHTWYCTFGALKSVNCEAHLVLNTYFALFLHSISFALHLVPRTSCAASQNMQGLEGRVVFLGTTYQNFNQSTNQTSDSHPQHKELK